VTAPSAVASMRVAAPPPAVWAQLLAGDFIARYLGLQLPAAALAAGSRHPARDREGCELTLAITEAAAPAALAVQLLREGRAGQVVRWTIEPCAGGSRLTVVHEAARPDEPAEAISSLLAQTLAQTPAAALGGSRIASTEALQAARAYLGGTAEAVRELIAAMPARAGYTRPQPGAFSLAEHLWHLADVEEFGWIPRFERVLSEPRPRLAGVDGDRLAIERRYQERPWRGAARRFIARRRRTLRSLARLDAASLALPVVFAGRACNAGEMLAAMVAHDREHRLEMAALWSPSKEDR